MVFSKNSPAGFEPLYDAETAMDGSYNNRPSFSEDHVINIPLSHITTHGSHREERPQSPHEDTPGEGIFRRHIGRRRIVQDDRTTIGEDEGALTTMGRIYDRVRIDADPPPTYKADKARCRSWASR